MEWIRKHADSVAVIGSVVVATAVILTSIHSVRIDLQKDIAKLDKEVAVMKAVMIMKGVMPHDLVAANHQEERK